MNYDAIAARDGKWWTIRIPSLDGLTQARRLADGNLMAREWIAATLDVPIEDVSVSVSVDRVGDVEVARQLATIRGERETAAQIELDAQSKTVALAKALAEQDVPLRDIGAALGVSFQRAHQLVQTSNQIAS